MLRRLRHSRPLVQRLNAVVAVALVAEVEQVEAADEAVEVAVAEAAAPRHNRLLDGLTEGSC